MPGSPHAVLLALADPLLKCGPPPAGGRGEQAREQHIRPPLAEPGYVPSRFPLVLAEPLLERRPPLAGVVGEQPGEQDASAQQEFGAKGRRRV